MKQSRVGFLFAFMAFFSVVGCGEQQTTTMSLPPGSPTTSVDAALAYNSANKIRSTEKEKAISFYSKAIEFDRDFADAYFNRALTYAETGQIRKAEADLQTLKQLGSPQADTLIQLIEIAKDPGEDAPPKEDAGTQK